MADAFDRKSYWSLLLLVTCGDVSTMCLRTQHFRANVYFVFFKTIICTYIYRYSFVFNF